MPNDVSEVAITVPRVRSPPDDDATRAGIRGSSAKGAAVVHDAFEAQPTQALFREPAPVAAPTRSLTPGTHVGRYLVVEHVGSGGLGDVYAAYDPELDRRVAIKVLRADVMQAHARLGDATDRLRREAQALAKLRHPNVVLVHDVGTYEGEVFIAMEFAQGRTLLSWSRAQRHAWKTVRDVMLRAGEGLAAAHLAGLVHRDFKPANVVVGDDGRVTVLDFGLARAVDSTLLDAPSTQAPASGSLLTREVTDGSLILGTPPYMAPELYSGSTATEKSDQFAYCVSLYRVLFDRLPFAATTPAEYIDAIAKADFKDGFSGNRVPGWLTRVITRGLSHDGDARYPTMDQLLWALQTDRRRRRRGLIALFVAIPLLATGTAISAWALRPPPTAAERAVTEQLSEEARTAAARGYYVHPPPDDAELPTALSKVLELEGLQGAIASEAVAIAGDLREEFAAALIRHGDRYYEREGGAPFAADFYAGALVFDPDNAHAASRVALTDAQLASLVQRAATRSFSERELAAAQPLAILAEEESAARDEKLERFLARGDATSASTRTMLEGLVTPKPVVARRPAPPPKPDAAAPAPEPTGATLEDVLIDPAAIAPARPTAHKAKSPAASAPAEPAEEFDDATVTTDEGRARAAQEASAGEEALRKGDLAQAESHFHRALDDDRRNLAALRGLAELHYERGNYAQAVKFGQRARSVSPKSTAILLLIGDAYTKTLDYPAARKAYDNAKKLGSTAAEERLARLAARLGE